MEDIQIHKDIESSFTLNKNKKLIRGRQTRKYQEGKQNYRSVLHEIRKL